MAHLVVDVSGHGFGHLAQVGPVVRALAAARPDVRLTLRTRVPPAKVWEFVGRTVAVDVPPPDLGMVMRGPMVVDVAASADVYAAYLLEWDDVVAHEGRRLERLAPDLVLADVSHFSLAAAERAGVPAVALCSLNWAEIYGAYCGERPEAPRVLERLRRAYRVARPFLQVAPHMAMADLPHRCPIGPVARLGVDRRRAWRRRFGGERFAAVAFGGIPAGAAVLASLPAVDGLTWIVADGIATERADTVPWTVLDCPFVDVVRSCELVVSKAGYGIVSECACNGTRLLWPPRPDWPETAALEAFGRAHAVLEVVDGARLAAGDFGDAVRAALERPAPLAVAPTGVAEAVAVLDGLLPPPPP